MDKFAKDSYYQSIIDATVALGYRFMAKVQIDSNDSEYFIEAQCARNTTLTFDVPGRAVFLNLNHSEHIRGEDSVYQNHWTINTDFQFLPYEKMMEKIVAEKTTIDSIDEAFEKYRNMAIEPRIPGTSYHWRSSCNGQYSYSGDIGDQVSDEVVPYGDVVAVMMHLKDERINNTTEQFEELMFLWHPHYTFSGTGMPYDYKKRDELEAKIKDLFWTRFGDDGCKIIREKVKSYH